MLTIAALPDSHVLWSRETGPVTVARLRAELGDADLDSRARTIAMWGFIATHPDAKPWLTRPSGPTPADSAESIA